MKKNSSLQSTKLIALDRRCLTELLEAELNGSPVNAHTWRGQNPKYIPRVELLTRSQMVTTQDNTQYVVTLYGLLMLGGEKAQAELSRCARVFGSLKRHYRQDPSHPIEATTVAKRLRMKLSQVLQSASFLARGPVHLSIYKGQTDWQLLPNEYYVRFRNFSDMTALAVSEASRVAESMLSSTMTSESFDDRLFAQLKNSESAAARECWEKAIVRLSSDSAGAITAARSLLESTAKYVLEQFKIRPDKKWDLPRLYKEAAKCLKLDPDVEVHGSLRHILQGGAMVVDGLAHLRNSRGDAHGSSEQAPKPARRHAEFAVLVSGAIASFLLATLDAQRRP